MYLEAPSPTFGAASPEEEGTLLRLRSHRKTTPPMFVSAGPRLCWGGGAGGPGSPAELWRSPSGQPICGGRFVAVARSFLSSQTLSLVGGKKLRCTKNKCDPIACSRPRSGARGSAPGPARLQCGSLTRPCSASRSGQLRSPPGIGMRDTGGGAGRGATLCPSPLGGEETLCLGTAAQSGAAGSSSAVSFANRRPGRGSGVGAGRAARCGHPPPACASNLFLKPVRGAGHGRPLYLGKRRGSYKRRCSRARCLGQGKIGDPSSRKPVPNTKLTQLPRRVHLLLSPCAGSGGFPTSDIGDQRRPRP